MLLFFSSLYVYVVYSINLCLSFFPTRRSSDLIFSFIWGVILINSILSYPSRGPYGKSYYRGNCTGYIIRDLLLYYKPKKFLECFAGGGTRSEEHTSELQSRGHLVCRLLREKKSNT